MPVSTTSMRNVGSPETVRERVLQLRDMGITYIFGQMGLPGMPKEKILRSVELFAELMPELREASSSVSATKEA